MLTDAGWHGVRAGLLLLTGWPAFVALHSLYVRSGVVCRVNEHVQAQQQRACVFCLFHILFISTKAAAAAVAAAAATAAAAAATAAAAAAAHL